MGIWQAVRRGAKGFAGVLPSGSPAGESEQVSLAFLTPSSDRKILGTLAGHRVLRVLGSGGMGIVLLAADRDSGQLVALKVLRPSLATLKKSRERFVREATRAMSIRHANVLACYALESSANPPFIVSEYMSGGSLQDLLDENGPLDVNQVCVFGSQIANGLAAIHGMKLVHSDLKPSNILLDESRQALKISDFGLARGVDRRGWARQRSVFATPQFASPEQVRGQRIDARSDLFSLGSVLYAMCTAQSPFPGESSVAVVRALCNRPPQPINALNPHAPGWLVAIIEKLMQKLPASRYQTAEEVVAALADATR